jgi:hypothetical protein
MAPSDDLPFVYERGLVALPTMATVIGSPGFWLMDPAVGLDWPRILHGEQGLTIHAPLPASGRVVSTAHRSADRRAGRGALLYCSRTMPYRSRESRGRRSPRPGYFAATAVSAGTAVLRLHPT